MCEPTSQFLIYALYHPSSFRVYVGKSSSGMFRPRQHADAANLRRYAHLPRSKWIQSLRKRGFAPEIVVLEECVNVDDLNEAERFHIAYFRSLGIPLLNLTDGGDGVNGYQFTDEAREKMSAIRKQKAEDPAERARLAELSRDHWADEQSREKKRAERTGKKWSPETRAKIAASLKGKAKSPEARANMAAAAKARSADPEWRAKQSAAQKISHGTDEARARSSEAAKNQWEESREKQLAAHRTDEARAKAVEAANIRWADPKAHEKASEVSTLRQTDPEYRAQASERARLRWVDPVYRQKVADAKRSKAAAEFAKRKHEEDSE